MMLYLYANGVLVGSAVDRTGSIHQDEELRLGLHPNNGSAFAGAIDDVRIYDAALDADQLNTLELMGRLKVSNPFPANGSTVSPGVTLSWDAGTYATHYDVYLGTSESALAAAGPESDEYLERTSDTQYAAPPLAFEQTYFWRVDGLADGIAGSPWIGNVWQFTTSAEPPPPPGAPTAPHPADGATDVDRNPILRWTPGTDAVAHDVYFGASNPPPFHSTQPVPSFAPDNLVAGGTYNWRVVERNISGQTPGDLWQITVDDTPVPEGWDYAPQIVDQIESTIAASIPPAQDFNVLDYGADADGNTSSTVAFGQAIAACHEADGGRVVVPAGDYVSGPIHLLSNVYLHVSEGATIRFTTDSDDYLPLVLVRDGGILCYNYSPLIYAIGQKNIGVTGKGTLDGQASYNNWWAWKSTNTGIVKLRADAAAGVPVEERLMGDGYFLRPNMIQLVDCRNVLLQDFTIRQSPRWTIQPVFCENVIGRGLQIYGTGPNNDGFNPDSCDNVLIKDCHFNTGDDCIAVKSGYNEDGLRIKRPSRRIVVRRCTMDEGHGAVTIGSEMSGGVRYLFAEHCVFDGSDMDTGLRFKTTRGRGGVVEYVYARDIEMGVIGREAIKFNMYYSGTGATGPEPTFRHFMFENIQCNNSGRYGIYINGLDTNPVDDVVMKNVWIGQTPTATSIVGAVNRRFLDVQINGVWYDDHN
jgi:polygalacturonase